MALTELEDSLPLLTGLRQWLRGDVTEGEIREFLQAPSAAEHIAPLMHYLKRLGWWFTETKLPNADTLLEWILRDVKGRDVTSLRAPDELLSDVIYALSYFSASPNCDTTSCCSMHRSVRLYQHQMQSGGLLARQARFDDLHASEIELFSVRFDGVHLEAALHEAARQLNLQPFPIHWDTREAHPVVQLEWWREDIERFLRGWLSLLESEIFNRHELVSGSG